MFWSFVTLLLSAASPGLPFTDEVIDGRKHRIYWSVDDHPCPNTIPMLATLKRYRIRATFFVNAWGVKAYYTAPQYRPNTYHYKRLMAIHRAGHLLGNHSLSHPFLCKEPNRKIRRRWIRWQLRINQRIVLRATKVTMTHFRPPHGIWCRELWQEMRKMKLKPVMWDVADYHRTAASMWRKVRWRARTKPSTILLFHCKPKKLQRFLTLLGRKPTPP